jgi:hypothetical protein
LRPDAQAHFPDLSRHDVPRFLTWVKDFGGREFGAPAALMPTPKEMEVAEGLEAEIQAEAAAAAVAAEQERIRAEEGPVWAQYRRLSHMVRKLTGRLSPSRE